MYCLRLLLERIINGIDEGRPGEGRPRHLGAPFRHLGTSLNDGFSPPLIVSVLLFYAKYSIIQQYIEERITRGQVSWIINF